LNYQSTTITSAYTLNNKQISERSTPFARHTSTSSRYSWFYFALHRAFRLSTLYLLKMMLTLPL